MIKIDWYLRIGVQEKDFIINVDWSEAIQKELIKNNNVIDNKKEVIEILKKAIQFMEGGESSE